LRHKVSYDVQLTEFLVLQDLGVRNILPVNGFAIEVLVRGLEKVELVSSFLSAKLKLNNEIFTCQLVPPSGSSECRPAYVGGTSSGPYTCVCPEGASTPIILKVERISAYQLLFLAGLFQPLKCLC
jgi:hypothetical protein